MFGIDSGELLIIALIALVVIGPKDLPRAMRTIGQFVGRARGMARHFRSGIDTMIREAELEEMEKKWKADNERIMQDHPSPPGDSDSSDSDWGRDPPAPPPAPPASAGSAPAAEPAPADVAPELPLAPPAAAKRKPPVRRAPRPRKGAPRTKDGA